MFGGDYFTWPAIDGLKQRNNFHNYGGGDVRRGLWYQAHGERVYNTSPPANLELQELGVRWR